MWAQTKNSIASCLLHCKDNIYQYITVYLWGRLLAVCLEWGAVTSPVMGSGVTLVYRGEEEVASTGLCWLVELPSIARRDYKWQEEKLKNKKEMLPSFSCHSLVLSIGGDGDKKGILSKLLGKNPLATTRQERTQPLTKFAGIPGGSVWDVFFTSFSCNLGGVVQLSPFTKCMNIFCISIKHLNMCIF